VFAAAPFFCQPRFLTQYARVRVVRRPAKGLIRSPPPHRCFPCPCGCCHSPREKPPHLPQPPHSLYRVWRLLRLLRSFPKRKEGTVSTSLQSRYGRDGPRFNLRLRRDLNLVLFDIVRRHTTRACARGTVSRHVQRKQITRELGLSNFASGKVARAHCMRDGWLHRLVRPVSHTCKSGKGRRKDFSGAGIRANSTACACLPASYRCRHRCGAF